MNRKDKNSHISVIVAFMLAHAANDGFLALFPPLLPLIWEHFDLNYIQLGGVMTFSPLFVGFVADYFGLIQSFVILTGLVGVSLIFIILSREN